MSQLFTSGDQRIGASASASVLPYTHRHYHTLTSHNYNLTASYTVHSHPRTHIQTCTLAHAPTHTYTHHPLNKHSHAHNHIFKYRLQTDILSHTFPSPPLSPSLSLTHTCAFTTHSPLSAGSQPSGCGTRPVRRGWRQREAESPSPPRPHGPACPLLWFRSGKAADQVPGPLCRLRTSAETGVCWDSRA